MKRFFTNFPIPVPFLIGIMGGWAIQQYWLRWQLSFTYSGEIGVAILTVATLLIIRSVISSLQINIDDPDSLLYSGPYSFSRNPMYLGWTIFQIGIAIVSNNLWMLVLTAPAFLVVHFYDVIKEEQILEEKFGDEYKNYASNVRRYI